MIINQTFGLFNLMLYLVLAYLLLKNAGEFSEILNAFWKNWTNTLTVLQGR